jgi:3'(2'), 5'-bisphosphate nucleotidase
MLAEMTAVISRSHRSEGMAFLLDRLPKRAETNVGGLGGKWMAIATGIADYYIMIPAKSAPKDWDFCAPEIILTEAGGCATHFDGSPILYNRPSLCQSEAIVASNGHAHSELAGLCQSHWQEFQLQSTR